ncbi:hypothetical protein B7P43_G03798, partial [Cryptotermes secundus]
LRWLQDPNQINGDNLNSARREAGSRFTDKMRVSISTDEILAELFHKGSESLRPVIYKLVIYVYDKRKLPDQWKESIIVPVHKKGDKTDCSNYRGISLLSTSYKFAGDNQCSFRSMRSSRDFKDAYDSVRR